MESITDEQLEQSREFNAWLEAGGMNEAGYLPGEEVWHNYKRHQGSPAELVDGHPVITQMAQVLVFTHTAQAPRVCDLKEAM